MGKYDDREYPIGKGKPPVDSQWKKGQSGNPHGRPKRKTDYPLRTLPEILGDIGNQKIPVASGDRTTLMSKKDALANMIYHDAMSGSPAHRLKAFAALKIEGAFDIPAKNYAIDPERRRAFFEKLAASIPSDDD